MTGDGHGHGHGIRIPSASSYKVENCPELIKYQERLAKEGLKDPWIRNECWRFNPKFGTFRSRVFDLFRGWKLGIPAFIISIAVDQLLASKNGHGDANGHH